MSGIPTLKENYCLKKDDFTLSPEEDFTLYAGRYDVEGDVKQRLDEAFMRGRVPKMYLWGPYGAGKTHTLYHIKYYLLEKLGSRVHLNFMRLGIIERKTRFHIIHRRILESIGRRTISNLIIELTQRNIGEDLDKLFRDTFQDEDTGIVMRKITFGGEQERLAWSWLCGETLKPGELSTLGISFNIESPDKLVNILVKIAKLFKEIRKQTLITLIDESEYIANISDPDSIREVRYAIRELSDAEENRYFSFIFAGSADEINEIGEQIMLHESIIRDGRLGRNNYIELARLDEEQVANFIKDILNYLVDYDCVKSKKLEEKFDEFNIDWYPFSKDAITLIESYLSEDPLRSLPNIICEVLNRVAVQGVRDLKEIIDGNTVSKSLY